MLYLFSQLRSPAHSSRTSSGAAAREKRGFNLIESAIILAVIGLVIGGIWVAASTVNDNLKITKTLEGVVWAARKTQDIISFQDSSSIGDGTNITSLLIAADVFPRNWVEGTSVKHPMGGAVTAYNLDNNRFDINLWSIPQKYCSRLATRLSVYGYMAGSRDSGSSGRSTLGYMSINGSSNYATTTFPITPGTAENACNMLLNRIVVTYGYTRIN